jgi:phosphodiesterase/alkaline phosphatase D-like protein
MVTPFRQADAIVAPADGTVTAGPAGASVRKESGIRPLTVALFLVGLALAACDDGGGTPAAGRPAPAGTVSLDAFPLGVASGDTTDEGVVLWTYTPRAAEISIDIATKDTFDESQREPAQRDAEAGTVTYRASGLEADTRYYYRFAAGDLLSTTGTFVTAPAAAEARPLRLVIGGDSDGRRTPDGAPAWNEFEVLARAAQDDADYFLYVGDTVYADREPAATTVEEYRAKYRENRGYAALREILSRMSVYATWDDHEVRDDYARATVEPELFATGLRAFRDFMPITDDDRLYRAFRLGRDADLIILDGRSYRDASAADACRIDGNADPLPGVLLPGAPPELAAGRLIAGLAPTLPAGCIETLTDRDRSMLGAEQKAWLLERLGASEATWKIVVTSVPVQTIFALPYDRWEGYVAERAEILEFIRDQGVDNVVFLATDLHANVFAPVRVDAFARGEAVAYEAVIGPIATSPLREEIGQALGDNVAGAFEALLSGVVGVECHELRSYSYGLVEVDGSALVVSAKDAEGNVLCRKELLAVGR